MKIKKILAAVVTSVIFLCTVPLPAGAEVILPSGLTAEKVEDKIELEYKLIFQDASNDEENTIQGKNAPFAVSYFSGDDVLYTGYYGKINQQADIAVDENTVFEWGSISKTMIWVSIMQLWEQGKLSLDDDIRTYLPDGFFHNLRYDDPITLTDLMNHKGGWCETTYAISTPDPAKVPTLEQALLDTEPPQTYRPGTVPAYSNWGAALAGLIVERVSGMDYGSYVHKNIFEAIGMEHTAIAPDHSDNPWVQQQRLHNHTIKFSDIRYLDMGTKNYCITLYPAGSAVGTLSDLTRYTQALCNMDSPLFKNRSTHEKMLSGSQSYGGRSFMSYGFAVQTSSNAVCYAHDGATEAGIAYIMFDPESGTGVAAVSAETGGNYIYDTLPEWVFGMPSVEKPQIAGAPFTLDGYYTVSRIQMVGLTEYMMLLRAEPGKVFGTLSPITDDLACQIDDKDGSVTFFGTPTEENGKKCIELGSMRFIPVDNYLLRLCLFTAYILLAVASIFTLIIDFKLKHSHKLAVYSGSAVLTAGKFAKVLSLFTLLGITSALYIPGYMGIPYKSIGIVAGCLQMVCMTVFAAAVVTSAVFLIRNKSFKPGYIAGLVGNAIMLTATCVFHMYQFWGI